MRHEDLPEGLLAEISSELQAGRKIVAVKLYKDATGLSLLESKTAVEALSNEIHDASSETSRETAAAGQPDFHDEILDLIFRGEKVRAVKLYKDSVNVSLREAKEFIEDLTDNLQEETPDQFATGKSGCLGLISFVGIVGLLITLAAMQT